jgi:23S rRNA pseudouridine1911/1915/1917 synthase
VNHSGRAVGGERLDVALAGITGRTRSFLSKVIETGCVSVDGVVCVKAGLKLARDQLIEARIADADPYEALPQNLNLVFVYEDDDIAVVDKPAGLVVHPAAGHADGTLVNGLLHQLAGLSGIGGTLRPGIVHRLDRDTSGLLIVAKNDAAHNELARMFAAHQIRKTYNAVVSGIPKERDGKIDAPVGRHPTDRKRMAVIQSGKQAVTFYKVEEELNRAAFLSVNIITGRTHQIRVHMKHIGHPILGDVIYGDGEKSAKRLMLHARFLEFAHPISGKQIALESALTEEITCKLISLRR